MTVPGIKTFLCPSPADQCELSLIHAFYLKPQQGEKEHDGVWKTGSGVQADKDFTPLDNHLENHKKRAQCAETVSAPALASSEVQIRRRRCPGDQGWGSGLDYMF